MRTWMDTATIEVGDSPSLTPPVDDLLLVYLGRLPGSRPPEVDGHDIWDRLGDFA